MSDPARPTQPGGRAPAARTPLDTNGLPIGYPFKADWEMTPRRYVALLNTPGVEPPLLVDCRRTEEWQVCRIPGALLVPLHEMEARIDEIRDEAGPHKRTVVVHCHHGSRSLRAAAMLRALGFEGALSLAGGIDLWSIDIDPSVPRY